MLFSQREGFKPIKNIIQVDSMDEDLRNRLWNTLKIYIWNHQEGEWLSQCKLMDVFIKILWHSYFKYPIDTIDNFWKSTYDEIRNYFLKCPWYEVYDFIEFVAENFPFQTTNQDFKKLCNKILEEEVSAYSFVGVEITKITSEEEISEIEKALKVPILTVKEHLNRALELLSDRKSPDYRNSIKESISAVESICKLITNDENATLGEALKQIEKKGKIKLHSALKNSFDKLYGYTSNADGIRHALLDESKLNFEDAKFMLVSCSAFVNYLIVKASKAGIEIS